MPGTSFDADSGFDPQDQAETLDDTHYDEEGDIGLRTFEELPDVLDVTRAVGDRDDDEAVALDADEFDEDAVGDADLEEDDELDYRARAEDEDDFYAHEDSGDLIDDFDEDEISTDEVEGVLEVHDAGEAVGGADPSARYESRAVSDEDLAALGYLADGKARRD